MMFNITTAIVTGVAFGVSFTAAAVVASRKNRKRYSQALFNGMMKDLEVATKKNEDANAVRKEKYNRMFAGSGIQWVFADVFQGVDILRVNTGCRYVAYYPLFDCIVKSADCNDVFTREELDALYTHEIGHKVNGHTVAGYMNKENAVSMELVADRHVIDAGLAAPLASALDKIFEVNPKGADYEPRMKQLQLHLEESEIQ